MKKTVTIPFLTMTLIFVVSLIASNLFETKLFSVCGVTLTGGLLLFPISYIINDCLVEVYGFRKARLVIWLGFIMNFAVMAFAQLVRILPAAEFWEGGEHFNYIFTLAPRVTLASLLAFVSGSTVNALVMSKMKLASKGRRFPLRAVLSSLAGETVDSLVFFPIAFWGMGARQMIQIMIIQVVLKTLYEIIILPVTSKVVKRLKEHEGIDTYDTDISYNPFRIRDI